MKGKGREERARQRDAEEADARRRRERPRPRERTKRARACVTLKKPTRAAAPLKSPRAPSCRTMLPPMRHRRCSDASYYHIIYLGPVLKYMGAHEEPPSPLVPHDAATHASSSLFRFFFLFVLLLLLPYHTFRYYIEVYGCAAAPSKSPQAPSGAPSHIITITIAIAVILLLLLILLYFDSILNYMSAPWPP